MRTNNQNSNDAKLSALLRVSRPAPDLPPGFQDAVWHRVARADFPAANPLAADLLDRLTAWFLRPGRALAAAAVMLILGISLGVAQGASHANELAKQRYLDSVSPLALRQ